MIRTSGDLLKEFDFALKTARGKRFPAETITDADYADDLALFTSNIEETRKLVHSLEKASDDDGLYVNAKKTEFMPFQLERSMKTLKAETVKEVYSFVYLGCEIANTESDVNNRIGKAWTVLNKIKPIWETQLKKT